jgi:hypothetical protein
MKKGKAFSVLCGGGEEGQVNKVRSSARPAYDFSTNGSLGFFAEKYRGKVLLGEVAEVAEEIFRDRFLHRKEWCLGHLWVPSCFHETLLEKGFTEKT